ncbi:MAG: hypothetical protein R3E62_09020 [Pseudomonadales bacterium]|jgi:hypothetical protein
MTIEFIPALLCLTSGSISALCANRKLGTKLAGLYQQQGSHRSKQKQMLVSGLLVISFGIWWLLNPGVLSH